MKKTLALLVTLAMAISMFAMTASAAIADDFYNTFSYDFEDLEVGPHATDYLALDCEDGHEIRNVGGEHGNVFVFPDAVGGDYQPLIITNKCKAEEAWHLKELPRKFTLSMDLNIKALDIDFTEYNFQINYHLSDNSVRFNDRVAIFGTDADNNGHVWGAGGSKVAYTPGEWFTVDVEFDFDANTMKTYVDDELILEEKICNDGTDMSAVTMNFFVIQYRVSDGLADQEVMLDNLSIVDGFIDRTPAGDDNGEGSPETVDFLSVAVVVASISLAGTAVAKKRR